MRLFVRLGAAALTLLAVLAAVVAAVPPRPPPHRSIDWAQNAAGPVNGRAVGWVGQDALVTPDPRAAKPQSIVERVRWFAEVYGVGYEGWEHTWPGAPLSMLWSGTAHASERSEPSLAQRRAAVLGRALDALVVSEEVPVARALEREHSSYYLQRFYCAFLERNPDGRVYLFERWQPLEGEAGDASTAPADWAARNRRARRDWERLADEASTGALVGPTARDRLARWIGRGGQCEPRAPIFLIPAATVLSALSERLRKPHSWRYRGQPMGAESLFVSARGSSPEGAATASQTASGERPPADLPRTLPGEPHDERSLSDLGVYVAALASFAVLYRHSPVGLPTVEGVPDDAAREIQQLIWGIVREEPRTGVAAR